jgi:hypothetical protein
MRRGTGTGPRRQRRIRPLAAACEKRMKSSSSSFILPEPLLGGQPAFHNKIILSGNPQQNQQQQQQAISHQYQYQYQYQYQSNNHSKHSRRPSSSSSSPASGWKKSIISITTTTTTRKSRSSSSSFATIATTLPHPEEFQHQQQHDVDDDEDYPHYTDSSLTVDMKELHAMASKRCTPLSLKDMYRYAVLDTSKEQRLLNAQFLHNEYV